MNRKQPSVSSVSNKATLRNEGFLSKLASTLMGRVAPPMPDIPPSTLKWHKTTEVKERIKTSTGTFAVYADTPEEEIQKIKESIALIPALGEEGVAPDVATTVLAEAVNVASKSIIETSNEPQTSAVYVALDYYTPDDSEGLPLIAGQKVILIDSSNPFKKAKLDPTDEDVQLLDNSAAKYKINIRPKKHHPDPRSRSPRPQEAQEIHEQRWLVKDVNSDKEGYVPASLLEAVPSSLAFATSLKRSLQEMSPEETKEVKRKLTKEMKEIKSSKIRKSTSRVLGPSPEDEARAKRTATIRELIETEEEFVKDLQFVMENYYAKFDDASTPKQIADQKNSIFSNFKQIADFHKNVLIEGVKFNAEIPKLIGKTFLRLERDFDQHSEYCCNEPLSEEFLDSNSEIREFFEEFSEKIGDEKRLEEHLKLPIQRLNDYQLLLKELVKFSSRLGDDTTELERAHELMQTIPQRATDAKFIASIEGFKGNLFKLGRLIRHDWFTITEVGHKPRDRYLFLFKARILITKVKRIGEDRSIFVLKDIIRLPETSLRGLERPKVLEFHHIEPHNHSNFPVVLEARSEDIKDDWLTIVQEHVVDTASVEDLLFDDEIRVVSEELEEEERGHASPPGEVNDLSEELPEDGCEELDQVVPLSLDDLDTPDQAVPPAPPTPPPPPPPPPPSIPSPQPPPVPLEPVASPEKPEAADSFWSEKELSPPPKRKSLVESQQDNSSAKRSRDEEEEEEPGFWTDKEPSPPLKKRASLVPEVQEEESTVPEVVPQKEEEPETEVTRLKDLKLEQVETTAVKADHKVAESTEEVTPKDSEEPKQESPAEDTKVKNSKLETTEALGSPVPELQKGKKSLITTSPIKTTDPLSTSEVLEISEPSKAKALSQEEGISNKASFSEKSDKPDNLKEETFKEPETKTTEATIKKSEPLKKTETSKKVESKVPPVKKEPAQELIVPTEEPVKVLIEKPVKELSTSEDITKEETQVVKREEKKEEKKEVKREETKEKSKEINKEESKSLTGKKERKDLKVILPPRESPEKDTAFGEEKSLPLEKMSKTPGTAGPRPVFTKTLAGDVVEPGENALFVCEVAHPTSYYVTWLKENKPLDDKLADRVQQTDEGTKHTLKLVNCRKDDSGIYTAKATDTSGASATCSAQLLVQELSDAERAARLKEKKPFFLVKMLDTEVIENTNLSYCVKVKGAPMPEVAFFKGNKPLVEDDRVKVHRDEKQGKYELLISHVQLTDAGTYKCTAKNKYDKVECEAVMNVAEEQQALQKLSGKGSLLEKGETADFTWFRDGVEFDPLERFNVMFKGEEDTLALVFQNVTPDDAGIYTCVASTSCGKISCSAELTVEGSINRLMKDPEPPGFEAALKDCHAVITGTAMLECKIKGYPKPELTWSHNGKPIELEGRYKQAWEDTQVVCLLITDVEDGDKGSYKLFVKNDLGEASCSCNLTIKCPPKFVDVPKIVGCSVGDNLTYTIEVDGTPQPEIQWMFDNKAVLGNDRVKLEQTKDGKYTLKIKGLKKEECGKYTIIACNDMGMRTETFEVRENVPPEFINGLDAETEKKFKTDHVYEVKANGSPTPTAKWFKDGQEITDDDKYTITSDGNCYKLKIKDLTRLDKGKYKIVLTNNTGTAESEGKLLVRAPPFFTGPLEDACAKEGSNDIRMPVEWDSNPTPTIKWMFKSKVTGSEKVIQEDAAGYTISTTSTNSTLTIHKATEDVVGVYSCKATNEYGDASCNARFRLHEPPQVLEPLKDVEFLEDNNCTWSCRVSGVPIPEIKWMKNGNKWAPDETRVLSHKDGEEVYQLIFTKAKSEDSAKYVAYVSNVEGQVNTEGTVLVNTPPHILSSNFKDGITFIAMHKLVLEVEATAVPEAEATWFCQGKQLKEEEDSVKFSFDGRVYRMERIGSDPEQSGEYKCKLKNKIKENEEVGVVTIIEKESRVRQQLKDVEVKEYTDGVIQCQIVGDPMPTVQWFRNGKPLTSSGKIEIKEDRSKGLHSLVFKNVEEADKSTFTVRGKNEYGECETTCLMTILVAPQPSQLQDTVVDYGSDLLLSVHIHAIHYPEVVWFQDGKKLEESDRLVYIRDEDAENYSVKVTFAVLEDNGTYTYKATNTAGEATGKSVVSVHTEVPTIITHIKSIDKCLEDEVTFCIKVAALPLPFLEQIEWRNKLAIVNKAERYSVARPEDDCYSITIKDLQEDDYGTIKAFARNLVGEAISAAELTQKKLPCEVLEGLEKVTAGAETDDITLSVKIRGSPRPKIVWTKDGDVLKDGPKHQITFEKTNYCEGIITLMILDGTAADSGQYRVRLYNDVGEAHSETALIVRAMRCKPKISRPPGDLHVIENEPGMFKARITGFPKPDVKWLKDGRVIKQTDLLSTGTTADKCYYIDFKHIGMEDAGRYTLVATNEEGVADYEVTLCVDPRPEKPEFLQGLKPTKVIVGYPCRMEVQLGGYPTPKVAWLKDGKPLEIDGKHIKEIVTDDGRVILQIDNATDADTGDYSVVASNDQGQSASTASLAVLDHERRDGQPDGPAEFKEGLKDSCFDEGKTIKLPVSVRGGPVPNMKWFKDGKEIKLDDRCFFTYDGDKTYLEIYPCLGSDAGKYKCVVENEHGSAETECDVSVRKCFETPQFTHGFPNQQQVPGGDAKFSIKVDGVPKPEISWFVNGKPIVPDGEKYRVRKDADGATLFVRDVTEFDSGAYKCVAKNREGQAEHQANLQVSDDIDPNLKFEPPEILKAIGDQELYEDFTAKFKALVTGRPLPEFEWFRNGMKLFPSSRTIIERDNEGLIRLSIKHVCQEDSGVYELKVWNEYGQASCKGKLICECLSKHKKRPVGNEYKGYEKLKDSGITIPIPDKPYISALSDKRVTLSWLPYLPSGPMAPVSYQVEMCEVPEGDWYTAKSGIRGCSVDIENLVAKSDYKFRVRVENKFGVSEPSPYAATFRNKLERDAIVYEPTLEGPTDVAVDGPYVPPGFRISIGEEGNFYAAPRFLKLPNDTQYGMKHFNARVKWIAFGYPTPKVKLYFKDEEIYFGQGSKYTYSQEASGEITLYVDRLDENDVGWYKCEVSNEYGESQQRVRLALCEYPKVIQHLQETWIRGQTSGKIFCRISGYPPCDVKWFKDWEEIKPCMKMRSQFLIPDMYCLNFNGPSVRDSGLYSIAAVNVAGAVSSSCMVHVEDNELTFNWSGHGRGRHVDINIRRGTLEDHYDIGDELGRGTQGVTYHCVEHHTGRNFAAKSMWGKDQFKEWMHMEYDMMNMVNSSKRITRLYDVYEGPKNMVLVTELCAGGELLTALTKKNYITEYEVASYIRQLLEGLDYMHDRFIAHLGLNIGDLMVTHANGQFIKIGDLSLARNIRAHKLLPLEYGMPEFVAPEVAKGENVSYPADMWAVGVITYILLSGTSPFRGEHDRETLTRIQKGELRFDAEAFVNLSEEAKDFVAKLLQFQPENRLDVKTALDHPWMKFGDMSPRDPYKINTDRLRTYQLKFKEWYSNASCRRWYRRRPLASAFTHPSKMVYPPGEVYTPEETPERDLVPVEPEDYSIPYRDLSYELGPISSDSRYQQGPDTFLLQLRDADFPARLRHYMNIAKERSPSYAISYRDHSYDYERIPIIHERRRFTDIMDEEIDDERRTNLRKFNVGMVRSKQATCSLDMPKRVKQEIASRYAIRDEAEAIKDENRTGRAPFLREKPQTTPIMQDMNLTLVCVFTGDPPPVVQWSRNDIILGESARVIATYEQNKSTLQIMKCCEQDLGVYKITARNMMGQETHKFRLVRGEIPGMCDPPEIEEVLGCQVLLKWRAPIDDGGAPIECYDLQIKEQGEAEWRRISDTIPQEALLITDLNPSSLYQFRIAAKNLRGWGEYSVSTSTVKTGLKGSPRLPMPLEQQLQLKDPKLYIRQIPGAKGEVKDALDYTKEEQPVPLKTGDAAMLQVRKYKMVTELARGQFSMVIRCLRRDDHRTFACKIFQRKYRETEVKTEYEEMKTLRHERLAVLYEAYRLPEVTCFIMEYLGGPDILTFLASKLEYSEQTVSMVVNQVLDGVAYLKWRGLCHLDIQPDNVVITSTKRVDVKLVDFGSTRRVERGGTLVQMNGLLDYISPEVVEEGKAYPTSDLWSVGVLTYVMLTGTSPFLGLDEEETKTNIKYVRFRFETLGTLVSQEATRFLMLIFKRDPSKRPSDEDCREHKWLVENDFMAKKRERAILSTNRLREYTEAYHKQRAQRPMQSLEDYNEFTSQCS